MVFLIPSFVGSGFNYLQVHLYPFLFSKTPFVSTKGVATAAGEGLKPLGNLVRGAQSFTLWKSFNLALLMAGVFSPLSSIALNER